MSPITVQRMMSGRLGTPTDEYDAEAQYQMAERNTKSDFELYLDQQKAEKLEKKRLEKLQSEQPREFGEDKDKWLSVCDMKVRIYFDSNQLINLVCAVSEIGCGSLVWGLHSNSRRRAQLWRKCIDSRVSAIFHPKCIILTLCSAPLEVRRSFAATKPKS
jgi:hypothetical protein